MLVIAILKAKLRGYISNAMATGIYFSLLRVVLGSPVQDTK